MTDQPKLVTFKQLKPEFGIPYHPRHLRRLVLAGKFPEPTPLSPNFNAWPLSAILAYIESKRMAGQKAA